MLPRKVVFVIEKVVPIAEKISICRRENKSLFLRKLVYALRKLIYVPSKLVYAPRNYCMRKLIFTTKKISISPSLNF